MVAVVAAFVSFASCGNTGAKKAAEDSIAAVKAADSIAADSIAAAADTTAADTTAAEAAK